jgi:polyisoprenyl-phosphate glycosyltransferase
MPEQTPPAASMNDSVISVCIVAENDAAILQGFVEETSQMLANNYRYYELLIVDNCSLDATPGIIAEFQRSLPGIRSMRLSRRYRLEVARTAALDSAIGDLVVLMDLRQDPPALIPEFLAAASDSAADIVVGKDLTAGRSTARRLLSRISRGVTRRMLGIEIEQDVGSIYVLTRRVVNSLARFRTRSRLVLLDTAMIGYRRRQIAYTPVSRTGAARTDSSLARLAAERAEFLIANSALPLRAASLMGLLASFLNLLYLVYILAVVLVRNRVAEGWLTTSLTQTVMFLLLFLILTILSEYIARILDESKDQPLYIVESESASIVSTYDKQRLNVVGT